MSGKDAMYDEAFEQSLLAAIFPKAAVAAGAFYRYLDDLQEPLARVSLRLSSRPFCNTCHVLSGDDVSLMDASFSAALCAGDGGGLAARGGAFRAAGGARGGWLPAVRR